MKISIITPTYNRKDLLIQTIQSVQQSIVLPYTDVTWEHIIYDDCSSDDTEAYCLAHPWPNTMYIRGEKNVGQTVAKNTAIKAATGEYILVLDSDDVILQRTIYNFATAIKNNPEASWIIADFLQVDSDLKYVFGKDYFTWPFQTPKEILAAIFSGNHFIQANTLFHKDLFYKAGQFDASLNLAEDLDLYIRFLLLNTMPCYISSISHLKRTHPTNITKNITFTDHTDSIQEFRKKYSVQLEKLSL